MRVVELVLGVQGVPLPVLWGPSLHLTEGSEAAPKVNSPGGLPDVF